jgi:CubicO group peptidase (beta-lactamase class C family)
MTRAYSLRAIVLTVWVLALGSLAQGQAAAPADLDTYAARVLKEFEVPGIAVAIVKDGVATTRGYGVRKLGEPTPVDENTLFGIASNTKAFTAAALAILADEGKLNWDDPVIKHLPQFAMHDPYVTREMTVRDLLTHRSGLGLGAGDLLWWPPSDYSREEIVYRLRFIKPATSFRSRYAYDNVLYLVAGQVIQAVSGKTWDNFVKERIFNPLSMARSNTSVTAIRQGDNFATPHGVVEGRVQPVVLTAMDNTGPAGSINSCVTEMARWVTVQLNRGAGPGNNSQRLFSERQSREMWSAQTILPVNDPPPQLAALRTNFAAYGLGWGLTEYRGHKVVSHTGGLPGYVSRVTLVPDLKLGIVVLTNQEAGGAFQAMTYHILDHFMSAPATDWISVFRQLAQQGEARAAEAEKQQTAARARDSRPSLAVEKYAGRYRDQWYGDVTITMENGKLVLKFTRTPALTGELEHWQYDTFIVRWKDRSLKADAFVTFSLKPNGNIEQMKMQAVSTLTDFSFDFQDLLFAPVAPTGKP